MAGIGFGGMSSNINQSAANPMQNLNQFMLQNLQTLIAANPAFLTGGIPTKLLSQMWMEPTKIMQNFDVSIIIIFLNRINNLIFQ